MKKHLALSAIGPDRPGIVNDVSQFLFEHGGSLEDSRMAILGGEFALVVLVSGVPDKIEAIKKEFPAFASKHGLTGTARETVGPGPHVEKGFVPFQIRAVGLDHEGIVYRFTQTLYEIGANIESMETQATSAPVTGAPMFAMNMRVAIPPHVSLPELRSRLQAAGDEVNVDVTVQAA